MISDMKAFEPKHRRLKKMYAESQLQNELLQEVLEKSKKAHLSQFAYQKGWRDKRDQPSPYLFNVRH